MTSNFDKCSISIIVRMKFGSIARFLFFISEVWALGVKATTSKLTMYSSPKVSLSKYIPWLVGQPVVQYSCDVLVRMAWVLLMLLPKTHCIKISKIST